MAFLELPQEMNVESNTVTFNNSLGPGSLSATNYAFCEVSENGAKSYKRLEILVSQFAIVCLTHRGTRGGGGGGWSFNPSLGV